MSHLKHLLHHVADMLDREGRPLREIQASPAALVGVPMETRRCEYPGSRFRHEKLMNISALRQMKNHWPEILAWIGRLRTGLIHRTVRPRLSCFDLWRLTILAESLPSYLIFREQALVTSGDLSAGIAGLYKIVLGIDGTVPQLLLHETREGRDWRNIQASPREIYQFADRHGHFIGPSQVCAGPENLIVKILTTMIEGDEGSPTERKMPFRAPMDLDPTFFDYGDQRMIYRILKLYFEQQMKAWIPSVTAELRCREPHWNGDPKLLKMLLKSESEGEELALDRDLLKQTNRLIAQMVREISGNDSFYSVAMTQWEAVLCEGTPTGSAAVHQCLAGTEAGRGLDPVFRGFLAAELARYLMVESLWLRINATVDAKVETLLGRPCQPRALDDDDAFLLFHKTSVRPLFANLFQMTWRHESSCFVLAVKGKPTARISIQK